MTKYYKVSAYEYIDGWRNADVDEYYQSDEKTVSDFVAGLNQQGFDTITKFLSDQAAGAAKCIDSINGFQNLQYILPEKDWKILLELNPLRSLSNISYYQEKIDKFSKWSVASPTEKKNLMLN